MKSHFTKKISALLLIIALSTPAGFGMTFTAVASGAWNAVLTWGGAPPPTTLTNDQVIIPSGFNVSMSNNVTVNGALAQLIVDGTLSGGSGSTLIIATGNVSGIGSINLDDVAVQANGSMSFAGTMTVNNFTNYAAGLMLTADLTVNQTMSLAGGLAAIQSGGMFDMSSNGTVNVSGGILALNGGSVGLSNAYNVTYTLSSAIAGAELTGSGLNNVTVNVPNLSSVTLSSDLMINGDLTLTSGTLELNGNDLDLMGDLTTGGTGSVHSSALSNISINTNNASLSGTLNFIGNSSVNHFTLNVGTGYHASISGALTVNGTLSLTSGTLNIANTTLNINGDLTGAGNFSGSTATNLHINAAGGISGSLNFETGSEWLNDFSINVGSNSVTLGNDLAVAGDIMTSAGSEINMTGQELTLNGTVTGSLALAVSSASSLVFNESGSLNSHVLLNGNIGSLTVNNSGSGTVVLDGDLNVTSLLDLHMGGLTLNGNDLTLTGGFTSTTGWIYSTAASNIDLNSGTTLTGMILFSASGNTVNNLSINAGASGVVTINSNVNVDGVLHFTSGYLNIGANQINIGMGGSITGAGNSSYIITSSGGSLGLYISSANSNYTTFYVGTASHYSPAAVLLNTGSASGTVSVSAVQDVLAQGTTGADLSSTLSMVDATWNIASSISTNMDMNLQLMWSAAMEVNSFDHAHAYISHYTAGEWDSQASGAATLSGGLYSLSSAHITSLSPFAVFDDNTSSGINEPVTFSLNLFPNPTADQLVVSMNLNLVGKVNIEVLDMNGRIVNTYEVTSNNTLIPVAELPNGNYLIRLRGEHYTTTKSFTKI